MNPKADEFQIGATPSGKCSLNLSPYESIWSIWSTANFQYQVAWILLSETLVQAASIAWRAAASLSKAWMRSSGEREAIEAKRSWVVEAKGQKQTQKVPSNKWIVFLTKMKLQRVSLNSCAKRGYVLSSWVEVMCEFYQATIASWNCPARWSWIAKCQFALGSVHSGMLW